MNSNQTCKPPELHTIMKKCNGTGLVLKICETKNNVWKKHELSILNGIDNYIKITKIKLDSASLNNRIILIVSPLVTQLSRKSFCKHLIIKKNVVILYEEGRAVCGHKTTNRRNHRL